MPTAKERLCCRDYPLVHCRLGEGQKCVTETTGFTANCLNRDVLEVAVYEYIHIEGVLGDEEPEHK